METTLWVNILLIEDRLQFKAPWKRTQHCWPTNPNIIGCYMLRPIAQPVTWCCTEFETGQTLEPLSPNISCPVQRNIVGSVYTALPTLSGERMRISHCLQSLRGCILPTMHCGCHQRWELLHPYANHCRNGRNNSQHCWPSNVESVNDIWNKSYMNCGNEMKMKKWSSQ